MSTFDIGFEEQSQSDRGVTLNSIFAIVIALGMLMLGLNYRSGALNATIFFEDQINGIQAQLPANWLLDTEGDTYILRAENLGDGTFNTQIQIAVQTVGENAVPRNIVDQLNVQGPALFANYDSLEIKDIPLGEDVATQITYSFVASETNPFLESVPVVVQGIDVVVIRGNQAIIFTFRDDRITFDENRIFFDRFLTTVEY